MSRTSAFLLLLLLLAVAGTAWVLFAGGDVFRDEIAPDGVDRTRADTSPPPLVDEQAPVLTGSRSTPTRRRKPLWPVLPTDRIPRGRIDVLPVYEDETPVAARDVRIRLVREGSAFYAHPLGRSDPETGIWRFDDVIVGWLRVVVVGDHVLETIQRAQVSKGQTEKVRVVVRRGGAITYAAELYSGERPEQITLELRHPETRRPLAVYWEIRLSDSYASPRKATRVDIGPEGVIFPVPPGRWILHATSGEGEVDQVDLEVRTGETTRAEIKLRK